MKRMLAALLALALLALPLGGLAEAEMDVVCAAEGALDGSEPVALPEVGQAVHGFELLETRDYPLIGAVIYRFEHRRTGAELFYIANLDANRAFQLTFRTQAIDRTGLPHVFEHATLAGSKRYPSKDLWFNLANGSYNTYMNAYTAASFTGYPVASLSEAQLLKFADFYTDCCLNPRIMESEDIFREEAWRYRMNDMDAPLTLEGTVYSEMLGALDLETRAAYNNLSLILPGAYAANISGGDPDFIPDMTYEAVKAYHDRYYHPSNCVAYLYGRLDRYDAFLALLDAAFAPFERRTFDLKDPDYTPITGPAEAEFTYPVEAGARTEGASTVYYSFLCPGMKRDTDDMLRMDVLTTLLAEMASPLGQAMDEALPQASWDCFIEAQGPDDFVSFVCQNCDPEDAPVFRKTVDAVLRALAEDGLPAALLDAVQPQLEIDGRLAGEASDIGVTLMDNLSYYYVSTGDPWAAIRYEEALDVMADWNDAGVFRALVQEYLVDTPLTALSVTRPAPGLREEKDAALAEKLQAVRDGMTEDALRAIVEASNAPEVEDPNTPELIQALTAVTVQSLPEDQRRFEVRDVTGEDHVRRMDAVANVDGIGAVRILLDAQGLPQEDIHWFHLFTGLIGAMDTGRYAYAELSALVSRYLYDVNIGLWLAEEDVGTANPRLELSWYALDGDLAAGYDLMRELVFDTRFDDAERLADMVDYLLAAQREGIDDGAYSVAFSRGLAADVPFMRYSSYYSGLEYYDFLKDVAARCAEAPEAVAGKLREVQAFFDNSHGAIAAFAGNAASIAKNRPLADAFLASLDSRPVPPVEYDLPVPARREALVTESSVQYNGLSASLATLGQDYAVELEVVCALVTDLCLLPVLRSQYGAYEAYCEVKADFGLLLWTYRDPNLRNTFEVFEALPEAIAALEVDQAVLDNYILSVYQNYVKPTGELTGAMTAITDAIENWPVGQDLADMRALKAMTPASLEPYWPMFSALAEKGARDTAGSASAINAASDLFDAILNPFGAVDRSRQALADVEEDDPDYSAIRYAFEERLMDAGADGRFGAADPATTGALAYALLTLIGEAVDGPEAAVEALVEYAILSESDAAEAELNPGACEAILDRFSDAIGADYPGGMAPEASPFTRADLARTLSDYVHWLDGLTGEGEDG